MLPGAVPVVAGANVAAIEAFWAGARICPAPPLEVKPAPETVADRIVKVVPPEFVTETIRLLVVPVSTFPKLSEEREGVNCPGALTVRSAELLVALPPELVTRTEKISPEFAVVVGGVV
jgi:hypothetical protein